MPKSTDYDFLATLDVFDDGVMLGNVCSDLQRSSGKLYCIFPNCWSEIT